MIFDYKIKFKNYKSFQDDFSTLDGLKNFNVFIGRNNSGKSSCVDIIELLSNMSDISKTNAEIRILKALTYQDLDSIFIFDNYSDRKAYKIEEIRKKYISKDIEFALSKIVNTYSFKPVLKGDFLSLSNNWDIIGDDISQYFSNIRFIRLNAERNIVPEQEHDKLSISENGTGAVNVIHHILNFNKFDENLIHKNLLSALNTILFPDTRYDGITIQKVNTLYWEIYLYENNSRFPLSEMGSGLKTIILVLLKLLVLPFISQNNTIYNEGTDYSNIIFAFEELENNLHPALQRRLFEYLYQFSIEHNTVILLTTHSHVAINLFADKDETQLYHIIRDNGKSSIHKVEDYITKCEILDDLDVRASDLLQSNGIIWVEGPSDKVYIKRWLEIWGDNSLVEGVNYQFLYYGGKILSHFTADPDSKNDNLISILSTNRNSAIVIDSDICGKRNDINATKKRIKEEFEAFGMLCWITYGKEIENYLSYQAINAAYNANLSKQCSKSQLFPKYIKPVLDTKTFDKVSFAHKVISHINDDNSQSIFDLKSRIIELSNRIKQWNSQQ